MNANGQIMAGGSLPLWERGLKFKTAIQLH